MKKNVTYLDHEDIHVAVHRFGAGGFQACVDLHHKAQQSAFDMYKLLKNTNEVLASNRKVTKSLKLTGLSSFSLCITMSQD